jgi:hypothetical protein
VQAETVDVTTRNSAKVRIMEQIAESLGAKHFHKPDQKLTGYKWDRALRRRFPESMDKYQKPAGSK